MSLIVVFFPRSATSRGFPAFDVVHAVMGLLGSHVLFVTRWLLPFVTVTFYDHCTTKESVEVRTKSGLAGGKPVIFALLPFEHLTSVFCFCTLTCRLSKF